MTPGPYCLDTGRTSIDVDTEAFIRANTTIAAPPLTPELRLHLATEITPLWQATEDTLAAVNLPPPFWAFAWPGGQALARHVLDHPGLVRGRQVLDFAAGAGLAAIATARAGAARAVANDIDSFAVTAQRLNAALNGVTIEPLCADIVGTVPPDIDIVLAGDICYEQPMADRVAAWLRAMAAAGRTVLMGDPGRTYMPRTGLAAVAHYTVATSLELEDRESRETTVWRVLPA
jgi:predicted nicotinamide N-methyase